MTNRLRNARTKIGRAGFSGQGLSEAEYINYLSRLSTLEETPIPTVFGDLSDVDTSGSAEGDVLRYNSATGRYEPHTPAEVTIQNNFQMTIRGGGAPIAPGVKGDFYCRFNGRLRGHVILPDVTGSIQIALWRRPYANYPPTSAQLIQTITMSNANKIGATWGTMIPFSVNDVIRVNVNSASGINRAVFDLWYERDV